MQIDAGTQPPTLLLLEHPHTYTFGRRGHVENLLWDQEELYRRGIAVHWVDRGGDVTYHGPGQLVGYPLLPLAPGRREVQPKEMTISSGNSTHVQAQSMENQDSETPIQPTPHLPQPDYIGYLRKLEETLIQALERLGVIGVKLSGMTGVWIKMDIPLRHPEYRTGQYFSIAKIAAIGVKVDAKGISRHGFALNVNPDMSYWKGIVGCGLKDYPVISLAELRGSTLVPDSPSMEEVMDAVSVSFGEVFGYKMVESRDKV